MTTAGKPIACRAAVCWEPHKPLSIEDVVVDPPRAGEVRVRMVAASICRTDLCAIEGHTIIMFYEGMYPVILGHEGVGVVESVGPGVTSMQPGDHVVPSFGKKCNKCAMCASGGTNLCQATSGQCVMADGTTRVTARGTPVYQVACIGAFAEYAVLAEDTTAKVNPAVPMKHLSPIGCCIPTGMGSALNEAKVGPGSTCVVWGLGGVGLAVVLGCRLAGATTILGVDINPDKEALARKFGCSEFLDPKTLDKPIAQYMAERFPGGGCDFAFESAGSLTAMKDAFDSVRVGGGHCVVIGGTPHGTLLGIGPGDLLCGKRISGCLFGGYHFRNDLPKLVDEVAAGRIPIDDFVTHDFRFEDIGKALDVMRTGKGIRVSLQFE
ncbi:alcohol dehydrogenase class-3-like [Thrips palmi]|uniref:Alcohol dehydrogenase class-3-like n=1 Tax=Thrips palmi TaxID=161013 RepID=A0A6P8ZHV8_THRPL|nr:alcohol dehydrogenase class-3-like [Thrips palmi]